MKGINEQHMTRMEQLCCTLNIADTHGSVSRVAKLNDLCKCAAAHGGDWDRATAGLKQTTDMDSNHTTWVCDTVCHVLLVSLISPSLL